MFLRTYQEAYEGNAVSRDDVPFPPQTEARVVGVFQTGRPPRT